MKATVVCAALVVLGAGCHKRTAKKEPVAEEAEPAVAVSTVPAPSASVTAAPAAPSAARWVPAVFTVLPGRNASALRVVRKNDVVFVGDKPARFDLATATWSDVPALPKKFKASDAVALPDDRVLVVGANDEESYCLIGDAKKPWRKSPGLESVNAGLGTFADGRVVAAGGYDERTSRGITTTRIFSPGAGGWANGPALPEPAWFGEVHRRPDGSLVMAAHLPTPQVPRAFVLDPRAGTWTLAAKATDEQIAASTVLLSDGTLVLAGGSPGSRGTVKVPPTRVLGSKATSWEELPPAPIEALEGTIAGEIDKGIVALFTRPAYGQELVGFRAKISLLDVANKTWTEGPAFAKAIAPMHVVTRGDDVFVVASRGDEGQEEIVVARAPKSAFAQAAR